MFIDTHLHLSKYDYENIDSVIERAKNANVERLIVSACERENMVEVLSFVDRYDQVYYSFGFHPSCVNEIKDDDLVWLEETIAKNPKIVAIGEIGLDYHYGKENKVEQRELFIKQLHLAEKLNLPVVIHSRDATEDTINILKQFKLKGVIHCFSGSLETANIYIDMGYLLGIGGVVTFSNSNLFSVVQKISLDKIVLETDSPYLSPVPLRGKVNESKNLPYIANKIAEIKQIDIETVGKITTENAVSLFDLTK